MTSGAPKSPDTTGAKAANKISRWLEPLGEGRFPIDVDHLALTAHTMYRRDDPITRVHGAAWKDIDGCLARNPANPKEWWLSYKSTASPERQRFTKAHELGHYVLHSQRQTEFRCGSAVIVEKDTGEANIEAQANQFSSCLLMPANHVRQEIESGEITFDLVSEMAKFYGVSFEAMCIRVVEITDQPAVLVYWDNGMMRRWSRSRAARLQRLKLEAPQDGPLEPPPDTLAANPSVRQCAEGALVPASRWFKNAPQGEMLREMKHTSDALERVLSLLIVPKFEPRWARDGEEPVSDTYDRFIESGQYPNG